MGSVLDLGSKYRCGELSPVELVQSCLARIDTLEPHLHAFQRVFHESAMAAAQDAAAAFARGEDRGPLQGIPVAIKDLATTREAPSAAGTSFLQAYLPASDAAVVASLRRAGAIIVGKTTLTEGAFSEHHPSVAVPCNPWAPQHWSGVSSSGSGVAVAAGLVPLALGSDTGGSIRFPSACNHLVGHKPTFGAVPSEGTFFLAPSLDHLGPMARSVDDCEAMFTAMAGRAAGCAPAARRNRIGVDLGQHVRFCDENVQGALHTVVEQYRELGFEIVDINLPLQQMRLAEGWIQTVAAEAATVHAPYLEQHAADYGAALSFLLEMGQQIDPQALRELEKARATFAAQLDVLLHIVDAVLCPVTPDPVPTVAAMAASAAGLEGIARSLAYTAPFDYSGHPALTLPAGFIEGVPTGYQLIGPRNGDRTLFEIARRHERLAAWADDSPAFDWLLQD